MHADSTGKPLSKLFLWMKKTINVRQNLTWHRSLWPAAYKNDGTKQFSPSYLVWNIGNIYFEDCKVPAEHFLKKKIRSWISTLSTYTGDLWFGHQAPKQPISKQISHINETLVVFLADSQGSVGYTVYLTFVCIMQYLIRHYVAIQKYLCYIQCFTFQSCFT